MLHPAARDCILAVERALAASPGATSDRDLARQVERLSDLYTTRRGLLAREQGDAAHLAAKREYFLASDAPKVAIALAECARREARFARLSGAASLRILDLGAGVGATSVGVIAFLAGARAAAGIRTPLAIEIDAVELERPAAESVAASARLAAAAAGIACEVRVTVGDLHRVAPSGHDLAVCQTALNEFLVGEEHSAATAELVARWARAAPLLLIEPALRPTTRALMALRDGLVAAGAARVVAPCLHQKTCPMRPRRDDWCHEAREIERTPRVEAIDRLVGRRDARALFSFLATVPVLGTADAARGIGARFDVDAGPGVNVDASSAMDAAAGEGRLVRLVTDTLGSRGKTERLVCRDDGELRLLRLLDRETCAANRAFLDAARGDVVATSVVPESDRIRPDVEVRVV